MAWNRRPRRRGALPDHAENSPFHNASSFDRLSQVVSLLPAGIGGVDVLVYTPEEFAAMQREGNAFAEMILEAARWNIQGGFHDTACFLTTRRTR